jgi:asparagine synthase (glutamine-hydrolysing)
MCGICGFNWEDKELVKKMSALLSHRGPDGSGYYVNDNVSFGHRRLSIIDISTAGKQPMSNEDGTIWITFNGEIFNFLELRAELENKGHNFNSYTDTEVIIHGYEQFGEKIVEKLNGQFAFAIWDENKNKLFLARDRLGIKPLFYYWNGSKFIFASELKSILEDDFSREINPHSLNHYLAFGFTPTGNSILKNIYKLKPGHILTLKNGLLNIQPYWDVTFKNSSRNNITNKKRLCSSIRKHLDDSVKKRLIADVPVGAFLSGGIDSSAIVASMKKSKDDLKTFSIGFDHKEFNETDDAKLIAEKLNTDHYENFFSAEDVLKLIPKLAYHYDDPLADYSMLPTYFVSQIAKKHVTVCLGGDGGDELFGGYDWYTQFNILSKQKHFPQSARAVIKNILQKQTKSHLTNRISNLISKKEIPDHLLYGKLRALLNDKDLVHLGINKNVLNTYQQFFCWKNKFNNLMYSDLKLYLPEQILTKVDRASMAHSLEVRVPFLDHQFVDFAGTIPFNLKIKNQQKKYILKKSLKGILPNRTIYKKKRGFGVPLKYYFRKELKDYITEKLLKSKTGNKDFIKKILNQHLNGRRDYSHLIWSYLMLEEWKKKWLN